MVSVLVRDGGLTTFALSNELDNQCIQLTNGNAPDGDLPSMFNETKYQYFLALLRGLNAGVKRASPSARTVVNSGGWKHYGWYTRLVADKLDFDIIGYHWYSSMGDFNDTNPSSSPAHSGSHTNVLQALTKYKKKIWITEMNHQGGSSAGNFTNPDPSGEAAQAGYLQHELAVMSKLAEENPLFDEGVIFIYELYNQPDMGHTPNLTCTTGRDGESCYGLRKFTQRLSFSAFRHGTACEKQCLSRAHEPFQL